MNQSGRGRDVPRQARRYRVEVDGWSGYTLDVSLGGFAAEVSTLPRRGSDVRGSICVGSQSYTFTGSVVWVGESSPETRKRRVGVRFRGVENAYLQSLT